MPTLGSSSFRPTRFQDLNALRDFLARAFGVGKEAPFLSPILMAWKYWDRRDDWTAPRSYVLEKNGVITAHAGLWPLRFGTGAAAVTGVQMIDWASAKGSPGTGLALVQKLAGMFDFIYSIGGSDMTRKVLPAFGFVPWNQQWRGVRPLRPVRQMLTHQERGWKSLPRLARNLWWGASRGVPPPAVWKAKEISPNEIAPETYGCALPECRYSPRTPAFFEYLLRCPNIHFRLYGLTDDRGPAGHFAVGILRGQARLAGVWLREPSRQAWTAAYYAARQVAAGLPGAYELVMHGTEGAARDSALQAGFRVRPGTTVFMLVKQDAQQLCRDFQFQLSDSDFAFLDTGTPSYWA